MKTPILRVDPTRSTILRSSFIRGLRRLYVNLKRDIWNLIVVEDSFGLIDNSPFVPTVNRRWAYSSKEEAIDNFDKWLADRISRTVSSKAEADRWKAYIGRGFEKGVNRAFADTRGMRRKGGKGGAPVEFTETQREAFLRVSTGSQAASEKLRLLRFKALQGVRDLSGELRSKARRSLTDGLVRGLSPREIAANLSKVLDISLNRAMTIARTELVSAHAEGQLEAMEQLGVEAVGVAVEWSTTGVACKLCVPLKGIVLKPSEARGMIPRHPNCYCAWVPANVGEDKSERKTQKRTQSKIKTAIKKSEKEEGGDTGWGPNKAIAKKRPESVLNHEGCSAGCHEGLLAFAALIERLEGTND